MRLNKEALLTVGVSSGGIQTMKPETKAFILCLAFTAFACALTAVLLPAYQHTHPSELICNPNNVIALHKTEPVYPAWKYECAEGFNVTILD